MTHPFASAPLLRLLATVLCVASLNVVNATVYLGAEIETNNTPALATVLNGSDVKITGNIFPNADVDYYSFTALAGDRVYAAVMTSFSANGNFDSELRIIASDGVTELEFDNDDGTYGATSSSIAGRTIPANGTYYVRVNHTLATAQLRPYELWLRVRSGAPSAEIEPNDSSLSPQALPASGWVSGTTSSTFDSDYYSINLNAGDTVFLSLDLDPERDATEWNGQVGLGLFGLTTNQILTATDAGASTPDSEAFFYTVKDARTYYAFVGVQAGGATFGTYHLSVSVLPVSTSSTISAYTSTAVPVALPTGPGTVTSTLTVPTSKRIGKLRVLLNLSHTFLSDLDVSLTAPDGNTVGLFSDINSSGVQTNINIGLDDEAGLPLGAFSFVPVGIFQPELTYRLDWFKGQQAQGTWTLTIRDDASGDGGTLNSWSLLIDDEAPAPAGSSNTLFSADFEANDGGFTHSGTLDEWERGTPSFGPITNANSGINCWKTDLDNTYETNSSQDLFSPNINLTDISSARPIILTWAMKYQMESANSDHAFVEIQEVGGSGAARKVWEWLGATMSELVGSPTITNSEAAGWGSHQAVISDFAGKTIRVRFHLDSDNSTQLAGLAIDDVSVRVYPAIFKSGNDFVMNFMGYPHRPYQIKQVTNLGAIWNDFVPPVIFAAPDNGVFSFTNLNPGSPTRFYRAVPYP